MLVDSLLSSSDLGGAGQVSWKHGRQLLRQYLQEIGYTDTIIDVRSNRVRSLLGLNNTNNSMDDSGSGGADQKGSQGPPFQASGKQTTKRQGSGASSIAADSEASVLATFEFLNEQSSHSGMNRGDDDVDEDEEEEDMVEDLVEGGRGQGPFVIDSETE